MIQQSLAAMSVAPLVALFVGIVWWYTSKKAGLQPPGPTPHPIVGHTFQVPTEKIWKYFERLQHKYGKFLIALTIPSP
jgi:hypothetical protein